MNAELFHQNELFVYNTLSKRREKFEPLHPPFVGVYVCGPTVYSEPHLGNCRTFISFDLIVRYLKHLGYNVRYVRNITDAGHVESTSGEAGDRISKQAKLEQIEPMEVVQKYSVKFHHIMHTFNALPPSIEPTATGHIIEQIEMTKQIIDNGFAYINNGSVYFDVEKFAAHHNYTALSGRHLEELLNNTRDLDGQEEKKGRLDFALWKKAKPEHLMRWPSPWGEGYPGWHIECSAMSTKYLGQQFDIHGGGMDLIPTHHTNEIAQSIACNHVIPVKYWLHTNMLTVNGQKMSKSLGNSFLPHELFTGTHSLLDQGYSPMTVRFFMLQAHYSSTLDFSNDALKAADKNLKRLLTAHHLSKKIVVSEIVNGEQEAAANKAIIAVYAAMNNDFNSPQAIAALNDMASQINTWANLLHHKAPIQSNTLQRLISTYSVFITAVLGLIEEVPSNTKQLDEVMNLVIDIRKEARLKKDFGTSDKIRVALKNAGIQLNDGKEGTVWDLE